MVRWVTDKKFLSGLLLGGLFAFGSLFLILAFYRANLTNQKSVIVAVQEILPPKLPESNTCSFILDFKGKTIRLTVNSQSYWYYKAQKHSNPDYRSYCDSTGLTAIVQTIKDNCPDTTSEFALATTALEFVHCLPYLQELDNYTKYPLETLVEGGGDCKDLSVLYATLANQMGLSVIFKRYKMRPVGHLNCAVAIDNFSLSGFAVTYQGQRYFTVETTRPGSKIGDEPEEFRKAKVELIKVS